MMPRSLGLILIFSLFPRWVSGGQHQAPPRSAERAAAYRSITLEHVEDVVQKLRNRGQDMREDALPLSARGDGLCAPCHTLCPGTARSLKPIHVTMIQGMERGLTETAPKIIRQPLCVDCHAYAYPGAPAETEAAIRAGDLVLDSESLPKRRPCLQPECHGDRDFPWALRFIGHMKQAVNMIPNDELFPGNTRYETLGITVDALVRRSLLKKAGAAAPWLLIAVAVAMGYRARIRSADPSAPPRDDQDATA